MQDKSPALSILHDIFGYSAFRGGQQAIVEHVAGGGDALVLMPTGGGKSLCYQIPALLRPGVGIVISPLIALMQDQVDALRQLGIKAAFLNSSLDSDTARQVQSDLLRGDLDLLYIAPERLQAAGFLGLLQQVQENIGLALFAIDEAHCVSQWGHDFRPEYRALTVLHERFPDVPRIALLDGGDFAGCCGGSSRGDGSPRRRQDRGWFRAGAGRHPSSAVTPPATHTADLSEHGLTGGRSCCRAAAAAHQVRRTSSLSNGGIVERPHEVRILPETVEARKAEVLERADQARSENDAIRQVSVSCPARRRILVANSDGLLVEDDAVRTRFMVKPASASRRHRHADRLEAPDAASASSSSTDRPRRNGRGTGALTMLRARPLLSGKLPVVLKRGAGGVLFHEACGHGLEADLVEKGLVSVRGRGWSSSRRRSSRSSTTAPTAASGARSRSTTKARPQRNVLIENGVLTDFMWDLLRARKEGRASSGNGRRETYQHLPMVRMTNTFLLEGPDDPEAIIRDTPYGLYCVALGGGQVNTATGDFVFGITEAYMIENGEITEPVRAAQLIGNGPETLRLVDAVGTDFDTWAGTCGKDGQGVPVSSGQPTLRVRELTVGGTAA